MIKHVSLIIVDLKVMLTPPCPLHVQVHFIAVDARPPALTEDLKVAMEGPARIARSPSSSGEPATCMLQIWSQLVGVCAAARY
jgi:hypothetical protein